MTKRASFTTLGPAFWLLCWTVIQLFGACAPRIYSPSKTQLENKVPPAASSSGKQETDSKFNTAKTDPFFADIYDVAEEIALVRGLPMREPFTVQWIDRPAVRKYLRSALYRQMTPAQLQAVGQVEIGLGILPEGTNVESALLQLFEQGVLGIYDPPSKTLLIGDYVNRSMLDMVLGHESAHGIQDMHFDLNALQTIHHGQSDLDMATTMLIEGDAQATYMIHAAGSDGAHAYSKALLDGLFHNALIIPKQQVPFPILARQLQLPYAAGAATIIELVQSKGWPAVDALYKDLPTTSEQMLHVDKLLAREKPRNISIQSEKLRSLLPEYELLWEDQLGESVLVSMLAESSPPPVARKAAAGWDGDRYIALAKKPVPNSPSDSKHRIASSALIIGMTAWDSNNDAVEFDAAFSRYLHINVGDSVFLHRQGSLVLFACHLPNAHQIQASSLLSAFELQSPPDA